MKRGERMFCTRKVSGLLCKIIGVSLSAFACVLSQAPCQGLLYEPKKPEKLNNE